MNLRHLEFFKELANTQHMSKAAENLGISQPSLSYAIKKLEEELGVPLFEPDGRNIKLTPLGKAYLKYVDSGLDSLEQGIDIIHQLNNPEKGHVNLGFTYTMGQRLIPELLQQFQSRDDNAQIQFKIGQNNTPHLLRDLLNDKFDVAIASFVDTYQGQDAAGLFDFTPILNQEILVALPVSHPLAKQKEVRVTDLKSHDIIMYSQRSGLRPLINEIFKKAGFKPKIKFEVEEDHTIIGLVEYGMGLALVPNLPQLDQSKVILKHLSDNQLSHPLYLITRKNHFLTPSVQRFNNFVREYCQQQFSSQNKLL